MLKSFKILCSSTNYNLIRNIFKTNNNLFKISNNYKFSSSHKHNDENHHNDEHGEHHGEPKDYHNLKFNRISYNQKLTKEQRKPYIFN